MSNYNSVDILDYIVETCGIIREELVEQACSMSISPEVIEESALAMAQATIQKAITASGLSRAELARRLGTSRAYISQMMNGDNNITIKTMARILLATGYEVRFDIVPATLLTSESTHLLPSKSTL